VAACIACANLEPTPASWRQFCELANEGAAVDEVVDNVVDALDAGADEGMVADDVDELLELPQPASSATAASVAETVPILMECAFPVRGSESTAHILDRFGYPAETPAELGWLPTSIAMPVLTWAVRESIDGRTFSSAVLCPCADGWRSSLPTPGSTARASAQGARTG
jgi:hypothetical protein